MTLENVFGLKNVNGEPLLFVSKEFKAQTDYRFVRVPEYSSLGSRPVFLYNQFIFYQLEEFGAITILNQNLDRVKALEPGFNLYNTSPKRFENKLLLPNRKTKTYWELNPELVLSDTKYYKKSDYYDGINIYSYVDSTLTSYALMKEVENWKIDLKELASKYQWEQKNTNVKPGSIQLQNGIFGRPLFTRERLMIPLEGGGLVCFNSHTGKIQWNFFPSFPTFEFDYSYQELWTYNQESLYNIDIKDGTILKEINFKKSLKGREFSPSLPIRIYPNRIILSDHFKGKIVVIKKDENSVEELIDAEEQFPIAKETIQLFNEKLFIHNSSKNKLKIITLAAVF